MRKQIINPETRPRVPGLTEPLDLEKLARVELTSEDPASPIESAFRSNDSQGWRAAQSGKQLVRLVFDQPQHIHRIYLEFQEKELQRTQEFTLRWSSDGRSYREIVRQQYNFGPPDSTQESEEYAVELDGVTSLELEIVPDIGHGEARASLERLMLE